MPEKSWLVNATYYGHGDNLDDFYADSVGVSISQSYKKCLALLSRRYTTL